MKSIQNILLLLLLAIPFNLLFSQQYELSSENKKALKYYKDGELSFINREYDAAELSLKRAVSKDPNFIEAWLLLGDVHTDMKKTGEAINDFEKALSIDPDFFPRVYYFLGKLEMEEGNYQPAIDHMNKYLSLNDRMAAARQDAKDYIKKAEFAQYAMAHPVDANPLNSGPPLSSSHDEFINFANEYQNRIVLTRKVAVGKDMQNRVVFSEQFFNAYKTADGWQEPEAFNLYWKKDLNMGGMNLSIDGQKMYFTGCNWPDSYGSCDLYVAFKEGRKWDPPTNLGTVVNSQWWDSQPVASSNGKRIYFSSKRAGGKGGSDLWVSMRLPNGKWSPAVNLGDSINTKGNEMSPFLHADGKTLYFSSDGQIGLGGADLFISRMDETGRWSKAENLGYPINTKYDEINLNLSFDGSVTWISSNRADGYGGFDLYHFGTPDKIKPEDVYFVKGIVKDKISGKLLKANVRLTDLLSGIPENEVATNKADGRFLTVLHSSTDYAFNISSPGYLFYSENFNLKDTSFQKSIEKVFELEPIQSGSKMTLNNLFFDFNSSDVKNSSYPELNKLVQLLNENKELVILITGHTDSIGGQEYNLPLSEKRAQSVYQYLIQEGINEVRLSFKGLGAAEPISTNDTDEGRAKNRRTEIEIL